MSTRDGSQGGPPSSVPAPSLSRNVAWTLAGNVGYAASQALTLVLVARLGSTELLGRYVLALAVTTPVFMFTSLQLRGVMSTDAQQEHPPGHYLALRLLTSGAALGVVALIAVGGLVPDGSQDVLAAMGLAKALESVNDVVAGMFHGRERMSELSTSLLLRAGLEPLALAAGLWSGGGLLLGVVGIAAARGAVLVAYDLRVAATLGGAAAPVRPVWDLGALRGLGRLAAPLGLTLLLVALGTNIPRYFIAHHLGEAQLGLFGAMFSLTQPGVQVVSAVGQSSSPRLARLHALGDRAGFTGLLLRLLGLSALAGSGGVVVALLAARPLLTLIYGAERAVQHDVLVVIMVAAALTYLGNILGIAVTATRQFRRLVGPYALAPCVALTSSWLLVPAHGLHGAALASCLVGLAACAAPLTLLLTAARK